MKTILHKADTRGSANHGWLKTNYTFSFSDYYNPDRIHFGKLRVLNDDTIAPAMGFGLHPHDNMEIITIPLSGAVKHTDNTGGDEIIAHGQVQVMTAGTGIWHSEFNASQSEELRLLQIWIFPETKGLKPGYKTKTYDFETLNNELKLVASPVNYPDDTLKINQQAYVSFGKLEEGQKLNYNLYRPENGIYLFVIEGSLAVNEQILERRDGLGMEQINNIVLGSLDKTEFVVFEVPMQ